MHKDLDMTPRCLRECEVASHPQRATRSESQMGTEVRVPVQGEGMESCVIAQWYVQRGESVAAGQPMFAIETAKAVYDVPAQVRGSGGRSRRQRGTRAGCDK